SIIGVDGGLLAALHRNVGPCTSSVNIYVGSRITITPFSFIIAEKGQLTAFGKYPFTNLPLDTSYISLEVNELFGPAVHFFLV
ncbi:hypothetical protein ACJX0J_020394, partial [Zea mays]